MSAEAYAVLGVMTDVSKIRTQKKVRKCECDLSEQDLEKSFCSYCGKEVYKVISCFIDEFDDDYELLCGYRVLVDWNKESAFIGYRTDGVSVTDDDNPAMQNVVTDMAKLKSNMRDSLESLGLWEESLFGVWCVVIPEG
jgi:hypothetical protein